MAKKTKMVYLMTALLLLMILFLWASSWENDLVSFVITTDESTHRISLWKNESGCYYVFLPSYAELDQVEIDLHSKKTVRMNGIKLKDGMRCTDFSENTVYPFTFAMAGSVHQAEILFLRSSNVAAMYVDTQSGSMDYIHKEKGNAESGVMHLYLPDGTLNYSGELTSIQGRGNSSWAVSEKKPYSLHLAGPGDLLSLGSAQNWVLLANAFDTSHVRNKVIYAFADQMGLPYTPESDWVDLYLNGEYAGLYLLCERNEVHPERVHIADAESFLVSLELPDRLMAQKYPYISTEAGVFLRIHTPVNPTREQLQDLQHIWQSVENAILAEDDMDPATGQSWMEQLDMDSWVKKYLLEELFANVDACAISQYFYMDGTDGEKKIYAGPVWDYDHALGVEEVWQAKAPNGLYANREALKPGIMTPWFHNLYQKDIFAKRVRELYQQECLPLIYDFFDGYLADCCNQIADAYVLDQIRWELERISLHEQSAYLQHFIEERIDFLNQIWIAQLPYYTVKLDTTKGSNYGYYGVFPGGSLSCLPVLENTETLEFLGWYVSDTGEVFRADTPVDRDLTVCARWQERPMLWYGRLLKLLPLLVFALLLVVLLIINHILCDRYWNTVQEKHRQLQS